MNDRGPELHLVLTDSGLGGLAVCAALERALRRAPRSAGPGGQVRLTFFNAAPGPRRGYNDLPDLAARAALLDRTLAAMQALRPDRIVLACNTLSVLYGHTDHARSGACPVAGIIDAGVRLFAAALREDPDGSLVLLGTRTTIESGEHRRRLLSDGAASERIAAISCHGLARAIETDPDGPAVDRLIRQCAAALASLELPGRRLYAGLACTHYGFAGERIRCALAEASGREVRLLDPNQALAEEVAAALGAAGPDAGQGAPAITVRVLSQVPLPEPGLRAFAAHLEPVSGLTARALLSYTCDPQLF